MFRNRYAIMGGYQNHQVIGYRHLAELVEKVHDIAYRIKIEDAVDLPPFIDETRTIQLEPRAQAVYKMIEEDCYAALNEESEVTARNVLTQLLRLSQVTGGYIRNDAEATAMEVSTAKLEALEDIVDTCMDEGKKVVVFARFVPEIEAIEKMLKRKGLGYSLICGATKDRADQVKQFQEDPNVKVFVGQLQTTGMGLTLTAANVAVFYSLDFSYANYEQSRARIIFEKENLETLQESSEFVLTIMASLAEEESRSISNNIRWSVKKKFQEGKVILNTKNFLGYTREKNGTVLKIVPEEAMTVRRIYAEFLDGCSLKEIADGLMRDGILSPTGMEKWHPSTIKSILQNEKYKGDCHLQKTYLPDFLSPRRIKNDGIAQSWYVEDSHAAIISKDTFEMVQQEFRNRQSLRSSGETGCGKFSGKYPFSGMIVCGECGETYRRHQQYNKYKKYYIWVCKRHENIGADACKSKPIKETALEQAFIRALNRLIINKEEILDRLQTATASEISDSCATEIVDIDTAIETLQDKISTEQ